MRRTYNWRNFWLSDRCPFNWFRFFAGLLFDWSGNFRFGSLLLYCYWGLFDWSSTLWLSSLPFLEYYQFQSPKAVNIRLQLTSFAGSSAAGVSSTAAGVASGTVSGSAAFSSYQINQLNILRNMQYNNQTHHPCWFLNTRCFFYGGGSSFFFYLRCGFRLSSLLFL